MVVLTYASNIMLIFFFVLISFLVLHIYDCRRVGHYQQKMLKFDVLMYLLYLRPGFWILYKCEDGFIFWFFNFFTCYRWNTLSANDQNESYPTVAPNFIVEIRSRSDTPDKVHEKMLIWMNAGVEVRLIICWFTFIDHCY